MDVKQGKDADILQTADQISKSVLEFTEQLKSKQDADPSVVQMLETVPTVITYLKNKTTMLEQDLQGLVELVSQYKEKVFKDNEKVKLLTEKLESENKSLKAKLLIWEDTMIRIDANQRRKQNLERIKNEVEEEEKNIFAAIQSLSSQH